MEVLTTIFNCLCWLAGLPVVVCGMIYLVYELSVLIAEGIRGKLRKNKRFMEWLSEK